MILFLILLYWKTFEGRIQIKVSFLRNRILIHSKLFIITFKSFSLSVSLLSFSTRQELNKAVLLKTLPYE